MFLLQNEKKDIPLRCEKQKTLFETLKITKTAERCNFQPLDNLNNNLKTFSLMLEIITKVVFEETTKLIFEFLIRYLKRKYKGIKKKRKKKRK